MHPPVAEHMGGKAERAEDRRKRCIADAEAAGIGAERRHDRAAVVAGEAAPVEGAATARNARLGVEMAGDLAARPRRFVAEGQRPDRDCAAHLAAEIIRQVRIVIAGDPDPVATGLQRAECGALRGAEPLMGIGIVETVAQGDDRAGIMARDDRRARPGRWRRCRRGVRAPAAP